MKKLLALVLVLAVASVASASLVGENFAGADAADLGSFAITATPGNLTGSGGYWAIIPVTPGATITSALVLTGSTADASGLFGDTAGTGILAGGGVWGFTGSFSTLNVPADTALVSGLTGTEAVAVEVLLIADDFSGAVSAGVFAVPEPATMVLLGLGGLLIRRKK